MFFVASFLPIPTLAGGNSCTDSCAGLLLFWLLSHRHESASGGWCFKVAPPVGIRRGCVQYFCASIIPFVSDQGSRLWECLPSVHRYVVFGFSSHHQREEGLGARGPGIHLPPPPASVALDTDSGDWFGCGKLPSSDCQSFFGLKAAGADDFQHLPGLRVDALREGQKSIAFLQYNRSQVFPSDALSRVSFYTEGSILSALIPVGEGGKFYHPTQFLPLLPPSLSSFPGGGVLRACVCCPRTMLFSQYLLIIFFCFSYCRLCSK